MSLSSVDFPQPEGADEGDDLVIAHLEADAFQGLERFAVDDERFRHISQYDAAHATPREEKGLGDEASPFSD